MFGEFGIHKKYVSKCSDFRNFQDSTIVKSCFFTDRFGPMQISKVFKHIPYLFKLLVDLVGLAVLIVRASQNVHCLDFHISEIYQESTIQMFLFMNTL